MNLSFYLQRPHSHSKREIKTGSDLGFTERISGKPNSRINPGFNPRFIKYVSRHSPGEQDLTKIQIQIKDQKMQVQ